MGLIYRNMALKGHRGDRLFNALFDSGSSESLVRKDLAEEIAIVLRLSTPPSFEMGKGTLSIREPTGILDVVVNGFDLFWHFLLVPRLTEEPIMGADFLQRWKIGLDPESDGIIVGEKALKLNIV